MIVKKEIYEKQNGVLVLREIIDVEVPDPVDVIAEKEAELLKMYEELENLKNQINQ